MFAAVLLLTAAFERHSRLMADSFASKVTHREDAVQALIILSALSSVEGNQFILESMGQTPPEHLLLGGPPSPVQKYQVVTQAVSYYYSAQHVPDVLEFAGTLFSPVPLAAHRLNRLGGIPRQTYRIARGLSWAGRTYARMLGVDPDHVTGMSELVKIGWYGVIGIVGGATAVALFAILTYLTGKHYHTFLAVVEIVATVTGLAVGRRAYREGFWAGRLGWACTAASVAFTCAAMIGICLVGGSGFSEFAMQFPLSFVIVLLFVALAAMLYARIAAARGVQMGHWPVGG